MKKFIVCFVVLVFVMSLSIVVFGRTMEEEAQAVRDYLNVVDAKLATAKEAHDTQRVKLLHAEKEATLTRWYKLKNEMASVPAPVAAVPPTVVVVQQPAAPPTIVVVPAPVVAKPVVTKPVGLFGMGLNTSFSGQYIHTGYGSFSGAGGIKGDIVLNDFVGLGSAMGMPKDTIQYKLGIGYYSGGGALLNAIPIYAGGVINLSKDWMGGAEAYLTGGLNYVVSGNGGGSGRIGGDAYVGVRMDLGLGIGKTGFELGYSAVRSNTATAKGVAFSVSQPIVL
ncbi:MAG: hypothetical protein NT099_08985 [Candidatus Saganbacteria bacterium]|nr:hypothetical protein [Candidatus Saganbacteria bacterium]